MDKLLPCPFCGGEALKIEEGMYSSFQDGYAVRCLHCALTFGASGRFGEVYEWSCCYPTEAEAIEAWNTRAAYEMDGFFYLPKPKEPIVEVTETTNTWDGTKVRTDVFYQVREQAVHKWAKELDEHIIKRICEVWDTRAERTCTMERDEWYPCAEDGCKRLHMPRWFCSECENDTVGALPNYCPECGAKVVE